LHLYRNQDDLYQLILKRLILRSIFKIEHAMKSNVIKIILAVVIIFLGYLIFNSINKPVKFENTLQARGDVIVAKLKDIRIAQNLFRNQYGHYTGSFDSLKTFVKTGKIPEVKMIPDPNDTTFTRTISDTIRFVSIYDSIFSKKNYPLEKLNEVPYSNGDLFSILAGKINKGGVDVAVFEVSARMETYTKDLNTQLVVNRIKELEDISKFPGLKVGSMTEATTDGNWE
jgi:hypothetical protein